MTTCLCRWCVMTAYNEIEMADWQVRVIEEKRELDVKIAALRASLANRTFTIRLPLDELTRLKDQQHHMAQYSAILGERIAAFQVAPNAQT